MRPSTWQKPQVETASGDLDPAFPRLNRTLPRTKPFTGCVESGGFGLWARLGQQATHRGTGAWSSFLPPGFQALASVLNVRKQVWVLERGAPSRNNGAHAIPDHPNLAITFEEQLIVDQSTVDNAGDHLPITDDHA